LFVAGLVVGLGLWALRSRRSTPFTRLTFSPRGEDKLLDGTQPSQHLALAPDGTRVAFIASSPRGTALYLRGPTEIEAKLIPDTDGALTPFFSPDGRWLGFAQGSRLMKAPLGGGVAVAIASIPDVAGLPGIAPRVRGASWGPDGTIVFAVGGYSGLWRVPADGGAARPLTRPDPAKSEVGHRWPQVLPGGRHALFTIGTPSWLARDARIGVVSLESGQYRVILEGTGLARYLPAGHIVYAKLGSIMAVPFDVSRLAVTGPPVAVLNDVQMSSDGHFYADLEVSASGALSSTSRARCSWSKASLWVDAKGDPTHDAEEGILGASALARRPAAQPAGEQRPETWDIWLLDLERIRRS
jgi:serine/threonine-protein kinase